MQQDPLLNYQFHKSTQSISKGVLVFIHGLFGDMNNLGVIARAFACEYDILRLDLRNHGYSFHANEMDFQLMAQDIIQLLDHLKIQKCTLIGHSLGGKTAMKVADIAPELLESVVVIDIAPIAYLSNRHDENFAGLLAVMQAQVNTRQEAKEIMAMYIRDESVQQFMLKSFEPQSPQRFRFNLGVLKKRYQTLMGWNPVHSNVPILFIKGALSDYIQVKDTQTILEQFPKATSFIVSNADHWVHAVKPEAVIRAIQRIL